MTFDIYILDEVEDLEVDWDETIEVTDEILKDAELTREELGEGWIRGKVAKPWTRHLVNESVKYPKGALIFHDNIEVFLIQRME